MVSATGSASAVNSIITLFSGTTSAASATSFAQQLAATLEQYLNQSNPSAVQIDIQPESSQNSDGSSASGQFLVTATTPSVASAPASTALTAHDAPSDGASQSGAPEGYVTMPFGDSTTTVPTLATELANEAAYGAAMSSAAILNQDKVSQAGDPMSGTTVQGTNMKWDDLTQDQQLAYIYAMNYGVPSGQTMQDYLNANVGPQAMWNAPYSDPTMFGDS
ncbi:MAG TPA: hypothetical protein VKV74_19205 [Bryobacteraceae bacterium]|nr:hypothetical protein [Bryobacteraceae bacterium]